MTWWQRLFYGFNTTSNEEELKPSEIRWIKELKEKGCYYVDEIHPSYRDREDIEPGYWQRVWTVPTKDGAERASESFIKVDGNWNQIMLGNEGIVFFEGPSGPIHYWGEDG